MEEFQTQLGDVLVVGPDGPIRIWTETTLLQGGYVVTCVDSIKTLNVGELNPPRLIVVVSSQATRGSQASGIVIPAHPALSAPCIVVSDDDSVESFGSAIAKGAAAYLTQPISVSALLEAARRLTALSGPTPGDEKRRRTRRPVLIAIEVDSRATGRRLGGWMIDISGTGCRIELSEPIPVGASVRIVLHSGACTTDVALSAEVRWNQRADPRRHLLGIRFTGTSVLLAAKMLGAVPSGQT
jgi:CheY-like chemotaxis protein